MSEYMYPEIDLNSTERVGNYAPYIVKSNGVMVATVYGPMAAIAAEAICKAMESGTLPKNDDVFQRNQRQAAGKSDVRILSWGWNGEDEAYFESEKAAMEHYERHLKNDKYSDKVLLHAEDKTILKLLKAGR